MSGGDPATRIKLRAAAAQNLADRPQPARLKTLSLTAKSGTTMPGTIPAAGPSAT